MGAEEPLVVHTGGPFKLGAALASGPRGLAPRASHRAPRSPLSPVPRVVARSKPPRLRPAPPLAPPPLLLLPTLLAGDRPLAGERPSSCCSRLRFEARTPLETLEALAPLRAEPTESSLLPLRLPEASPSPSPSIHWPERPRAAPLPVSLPAPVRLPPPDRTRAVDRPPALPRPEPPLPCPGIPRYSWIILSTSSSPCCREREEDRRRAPPLDPEPPRRLLPAPAAPTAEACTTRGVRPPLLTLLTLLPSPAAALLSKPERLAPVRRPRWVPAGQGARADVSGSQKENGAIVQHHST